MEDYNMPDAEGEALDPADLYAVPEDERLDEDEGAGSIAINYTTGADDDDLDSLPDGDVIAESLG